MIFTSTPYLPSRKRLNHPFSLILLSKEPKQKARRPRQKVCDDLPETQPIQVADGFVTFTKHFKYLGSYISYNLRDDYDIQNRVLNASKAMGALKNFWDNPHVDLYSKFLIRAIPLNLLLWGCETWSMRKQLMDKLEVFVHRSCRRILHITMTQVKDERITNEQVRKTFYSLPSVPHLIAARQLSFIGKVIRGPFDQPPKMLLTAWCNNKRKPGRPFLHNKDFIVKNLKLLFDRVDDVIIDDFGTLKDWINEASDELYWEKLIKCMLHPEEQLPDRPTTWNRRRRSARNRRSEPQPPPSTPPGRRRRPRVVPFLPA